jgi:4-hydroxy-tetrahydrodipicolinate synthase
MFSGAMTAMTTPFANGRLDEARLQQQIERQISGGIDGLVPVGTTGESPTLDLKEHVRVLEVTVSTARGRVPVIAGTGANATSEAMEGLYRHFMTLADGVDLPIVLYNIPGRTGVTMSAQTVARLSQHKNIVAIKEATGSLDMASEIASLCDITILSGDDSLTIPLMSIGAKGVISVASNVVPGKIKAMVQHALDGDFAAAGKIHRRLFAFIRSLFLDGNPVGIKYAMKIAGFDSGELRLPLCEANEATRKTIELEFSKIQSA